MNGSWKSRYDAKEEMKGVGRMDGEVEGRKEGGGKGNFGSAITYKAAIGTSQTDPCRVNLNLNARRILER